MADPHRLQVLKSLCTHLEGIVHVEGDPDADYRGFNLAGKVFRGRAIFGDGDPETMLSLLEAPRPDFPTYAGTNNEASSESWNLLLQGWTKDDKLNPTDPAHLLMDAVERRLARIIQTKRGSGTPTYPTEYMLGGLISSFAFGPGVVRPPSEGASSRAYFYLPIRVGLASIVG